MIIITRLYLRKISRKYRYQFIRAMLFFSIFSTPLVKKRKNVAAAADDDDENNERERKKNVH